MSVPSPGRKQGGSACSVPRAVVPAQGADQVGTAVDPPCTVIFFVVPVLFCETYRNKGKKYSKNKCF